MNSAPKILILGAGISGLGLALALQKHCPSYTIEIFEIRPEPASIGGAVGLTPNAIRYLDHLDVLSRIEPQSCEVSSIEIYALRTASKLSDLDFNDVKRWQFRARRVKRGTLLKTLLDKVEESGLRVQYGKRASAVEQTDKGVHVSFEDETVAHGDVLVGADGIHSFVRMTAIQPDRTANYTGIATAYGFVDTDKLSGRLPFTSTGMYSGRKGSIMMSYHDLERKKLYVGAVMETAAPSESEGQSLERQGWKSKSSDKEEVRSDILERFGGSPEPLIDEVIEGVEEWYLYPVYKLAPRGVWSRGRCIIVGDAAHAMPPQGESIGLALEDVVLLARIMEKQQSNKPFEQIFTLYDSLRRERIESAFEEANFRWETVKDKGFVGGLMVEWLTMLVLWYGKEKRAQALMHDVRSINLAD